MANVEFGRTATLKASGGAAAAPSGSVGLVMATAFTGHTRTGRYLLTVKLTATGAVSAACYLWGRRLATGDWGQLGDKTGQLNDGNAITGSDARVYQVVVDFLGAFERIYLEVASLTGTGAAAEATLTEIIEV